MAGAIRIKPHHFVDVITAFGEGKEVFEPSASGHAVHSVAARILAHRDVPLVMELGADDICKPCVHNVNGTCDDEIDTSYRPEAPPSKLEWNLLIDRRWCERLQLEQGYQLTARELCQRLRRLAGDITDIYPEMPADRAAKKSRHLREGVERFLARRDRAQS